MLLLPTLVVWILLFLRNVFHELPSSEVPLGPSTGSMIAMSVKNILAIAGAYCLILPLLKYLLTSKRDLLT